MIIYLKAFEFDKLLNSINDENLVIVIDIAYVTGVKPTVNVYGGCRGLVIVQIPCSKKKKKKKSSK